MTATARRATARGKSDPPSGSSRTHLQPGDDTGLRTLVDFIDAFLWSADPTTLEPRFVTDSISEVLGVPASEWQRSWRKLIHSDDLVAVLDALTSTARDGSDREVEFRTHAADGRTVTLRHAVRLVAEPGDEPELWGLTTDVTEDKRMRKALRDSRVRYRALSEQTAEFRRQALADPLTGLPNRILFEDRLETALRAAERSGESCSVMLMDLDRFKQINDTQGHQAGDLVLKHVALRFRVALRTQDTPARLGGDEFAAVLPNTGADGAIRAADRFLRSLGAPVEIDGRATPVGASIGIAVYPDHAAGAVDLLGAADRAMYSAKESGGGYAVHQPGVEPPRPRTRGWIRSARRALIGFAAVLAILSGAMAPTGPGVRSRDAATRLAQALVTLEGASSDQVAAAVGDVEQAVVDIPWNEVAGPDVVATLGRLANALDHLQGTATPVDVRVQRLINTIEKAVTVARVTTEPAVVVAPTAAPSMPEGERPITAP
jgi:diguanylate cyclase (GGDEF)-like protein